MPEADLVLGPLDLAVPAHARALVELLDCYHRDPMGENRPLDRSMAEALVRGLASHPKAFVLCAWREGTPLGMAVCFEGFSTFRARPLVNLHDLVVVPQARRQGIAKALFAAVEAEARRRGAGRVTLEVRQDNPKAQALYASLGYGAGTAPMEFWGKTLD